MNQGIYRIIFNRARGLFMVAGECAKSHSDTQTAPAFAVYPPSVGGNRTGTMGCTPTRSGLRASINALRTALLIASGAIFIAPAFGDIVVDGSAPANQQATVVQTANGLPQVNIQTPNSAGVSHNQFTQFDVDAGGAILNNSAVIINTQLAGNITGNPNITAGNEANLIINEINSNNPSLLNGFLEVAGQRADVVVANPSGISCSGCGFINAQRATLTTGTPIFSGDNLDGFRVDGGTITINGTGLNGQTTDFTQIIARAVEINADIFATELDVVTGLNTVSADAQTVTENSER